MRRLAFVALLLTGLLASAWTAAGGNQTNLNQYWGGKALALFEIFPANGRGVGSSCKPPNLLLRSIELDNATWQLAGGGSSAPTRSANAGVAPDGTTTAERYNFPVVSGAGAYSLVFQSVTTSASTYTYGVYIKGVSGVSDSGTMYMGSTDSFSSGTATACAYTSTAWSRCTLTVAEASSPMYIIYGTDKRWGGMTNSAAQSVYLWGATKHIGSTAQEHITTTSAIAGPTVTGARGEVLTHTRTSVATCTKTVGVEPQQIANGDLVQQAIAQPTIMPGADGTSVNGLLIEHAVTNQLVRSQEINSGSWSKVSSGGASVPVVTTNYAVAPDGTTTAERVQFSACVANPSSSEISQSGSNFLNSTSVYLRGTSSSGSVRLCLYNTGQACAVCSYSPDYWTRCKRPVAGTGATFALGCINNTAVYPSSGDTGAADVLVWGAQQENTPAPTSYIPTDGATANRTAVIAKVTGSFPASNVGSMAWSYAGIGVFPSSYPTFMVTSTSDPNPGPGTDQLIAYSPGTSGSAWRCFAGNAASGIFQTGQVVQPANYFRGYCAAGAGTVRGALGANIMTESGATSGVFNPATVMYLGGSDGSLTELTGVLKLICRDPADGRCR